MGVEVLCWLCWERELWITCSQEEEEEVEQQRHYCKDCKKKTIEQQLKIKRGILRSRSSQMYKYERWLDNKEEKDELTESFYEDEKHAVELLKEHIKELEEELKQQEK
ncbi:hypothetical protein NPX90_26140 [Bacillus paranthracis]|uniref:hypothetical protein n=1 Tax=Bacillus paranthracis TaxID=2026186 RepID=UPI0021132583|nr:hypothetical protein [Bacillus paranthracis]MCQ6524969.1 hypothetical protein [Bacillus paranthracis]